MSFGTSMCWFVLWCQLISTIHMESLNFDLWNGLDWIFLWWSVKIKELTKWNDRFGLLVTDWNLTMDNNNHFAVKEDCLIWFGVCPQAVLLFLVCYFVLWLVGCKVWVQIGNIACMEADATGGLNWFIHWVTCARSDCQDAFYYFQGGGHTVWLRSCCLTVWF